MLKFPSLGSLRESSPSGRYRLKSRASDTREETRDRKLSRLCHSLACSRADRYSRHSKWIAYSQDKDSSFYFRRCSLNFSVLSIVDCHANKTDISGQLVFTRGSKPNEIQCKWTIKVPGGDQLIVNLLRYRDDHCG